MVLSVRSKRPLMTDIGIVGAGAAAAAATYVLDETVPDASITVL